MMFNDKLILTFWMNDDDNDNDSDARIQKSKSIFNGSWSTKPLVYWFQIIWNDMRTLNKTFDSNFFVNAIRFMIIHDLKLIN